MGIATAACSSSTSDSATAAGSSGAGGANAGAGGANAGAGGANNAGAGGANAGAGGANAGAGGTGPLTCGTTTCGPTQYCVVPCCGGAQPLCMSNPDGGACPAGTHAGCNQPNACLGGMSCCQADPCTPPPPYCVDTKPAAGCFPPQSRTCQLVCG
ncbi:MAG TPA: hypothetical protein VGI10_12265 [Polyangiaceae bacterium]